MLQRAIVLIFFILSGNPYLMAQTIRGMVLDIQSNQPVIGVEAINIHNNESSITNSKGQFELVAKSDHLIEFHRAGYRTQRIRIPVAIPTYFAIHMQELLPTFTDDLATGNYRIDSLRYARLYEKQLAKPRFSTLDVLQHPFSALSKYNRQIWAFQDNYRWFEQMKYVDYAFSDKILKDLAGLPADSAALYRKRYAIPYEHLRSMKAYDVFAYIQQTVKVFRRGRDPRFSPSRNSN